MSELGPDPEREVIPQQRVSKLLLALNPHATIELTLEQVQRVRELEQQVSGERD
jgi:hypothetical protein